MRVEDPAAVDKGSKGDSDAFELPQQEHPRDHKSRQTSSLLKREQHFPVFADKAVKL